MDSGGNKWLRGGLLNIVDRVEAFVGPLLDEIGCELVDIEFSREGHGWVLRLYIDKDGGVGINDCSSVSRQVSHYLEVDDPVDHPYHLEVSSPGLERPLKKKDDFIRFAGRKGRVKMREPVDGRRVFAGVLDGIDGEKIRILVDKDVFCLSIGDIVRARLVFEEEKGQKGRA